MDIGAYTGDTIAECKEAVHDGFARYYAFEPDPDNYAAMYRNFAGDKRITMIRKGVGSVNGHVPFKYNGEGSCKVSETDTAASEIEIVRLDDVLNEKVDFIKMDIEGMELEALKGAVRTLQTDRPILAISLYHKMEDIIEIPQFIQELGVGYKLYLRHYWDCNGTDTVLFAM